MAIELASFVNGLDETKPLNTDLVAEGDDHLRLLKAVLKGTFPGRGGAEKQYYSKVANFAIAVDEVSAVFDAAGAATATLPAVSGLAPGTHFWFWASTSELTVSGADAAVINGAATLVVSVGTGALVLLNGSVWTALPLSGTAASPVNLIEGANITITGTYPNLTIAAASAAGPAYPLVIRQHSGTITLTSGVQERIPFDTGLVDVNGDFDATGHYFVVPADGVYAISASCDFWAIPDITMSGGTLSIGTGILSSVYHTNSFGKSVLFGDYSKTLTVAAHLSLTAGALVDIQISSEVSGLKCSQARVQIQCVRFF